MKVIIIHSNNIPLDIIHMNNGVEFISFAIEQPPISEEDYDTFLSSRVDALIALQNAENGQFVPDLIVLPYSLTEENPAELTGIRLAAHIRLDERDSCIKNLPMLFLGPLYLEDALRLSNIASFLLTPKVYTSELSTPDALLKWIEVNTPFLQPLSEKEYTYFLDVFSVDAPTNYSDAHHSITNLWTLLRWEEMFDWEKNPPAIHGSVRDFANNLYFKWLMATIGRRAHFKPKQKHRPIVPNISGRIVYIDDEIKIGWGEVMRRIVENSKAELIPYDDFDNAYSREDLINRIMRFVDSVPDADCYILDLRLHEEDHTNPDYSAYTGHKIAQYIFEQNHGAQIVFFTASEKTINYIISEKYFSGYVIKENPVHLLNLKESKELYSEFAHALQKACSNAFLREYYSLCKGIPYLDDFFEILRQDDEDDKRSHLINMRSAALNLMVYIESTIKDHFQIVGFNLIKDGNKVAKVTDVYLEYKPNEKGIPIPVQVSIIPGLKPSGDWRGVSQYNNDISLICSTLCMYYGFSCSLVKKVIDLKNIRNLSIAHGNGPVEIKKDFLKDVFNTIVRPILARK